MSTHWVVDEKNNLQEARERIPQPLPVRLMAGLLSYLFHPLFIPVYVAIFLVQIHNYLFAGFDNWNKLTTILQVFVNCTFLPIVSVLLLKGLKFIDSVYLKTQRERIIPYSICMIFYFWNWYVFKNNFAPQPLVAFSLAIFVGCIAGFMANIYIKISMHTIAVGVMLTLVALLAFRDSANYTLFIAIALLITGMVATARLIFSDHTSAEVYGGLLIGVLSQLVAYWIA
ncbi:MAG: hypothetical protein GC171_11700 [Terrimonas sp.]|nr:hypothetical protein [Terrimonas sp.]